MTTCETCNATHEQRADGTTLVHPHSAPDCPTCEAMAQAHFATRTPKPKATANPTTTLTPERLTELEERYNR